MAKLARNHGDPALLAFVGQLLDDHSLFGDAQVVARKVLDQGADALDANERILLEQQVIEPYISACEACGTEPSWAEMLHVYDTGLCATCFDKPEGVATPAVRPAWMPLIPPPQEPELPGEDEDEAVAEPVPLRA